MTSSESTLKGVNGYVSGQPFEQQAPAAHGPNSMSGSNASGSFNAGSTNAPSAGNTASSAASEGNGSVPKDEVGWYFVEQYYTTLSKNPEKLHLFYSKRSQFVSGVEAEKVSVSVGQRAINERIKELDISDCKVRVSNVDSQESFKNIVVQVIGEMSNKAAPHRKFVQTFVLAEQPNGYFVLNDIFRYIVEEDEEEPIEPEGPAVHEPPPTAAPEAEPETLTSSADPKQQQRDVEQVDKKLEEELKDHAESIDAPAETQIADETSAVEPVEADTADETPVAAEPTQEDPSQSEQQSIAVEKATEATTDDDLQQEKPKAAEPTPAASPPKSAAAVPAQAPTPSAPQKPAAPKTWANLVAANRAAPPAVPNPATSTSPATSQTKAPQAQPNRSTSPQASTKEDPAARSQANGNSGWQTAGQDSAKRQNRQQSMSGSPDKDNVLGYVKNVTDKVDASILKEKLLQHGKLMYFDVSRQKNCAFVEFADAAGYQSAVAANPYEIGGEAIYVEERRPRPNAYGGNYNARGGMRGGRGGSEGRGGSQGRGGFPKDGRGGFTPRGGRGGNMAPRGRGQPQPA